MSILYNCVHQLYNTHTYTGAANTWLYTGAYVTVPPNSFYVLQGYTGYSHAAVKQASLDTGSAAGGYTGNITEYFGGVYCYRVGKTGDTATSFYGKAIINSALSGSNTNAFTISGWYITLPN